jgi:hypothetical protein
MPMERASIDMRNRLTSSLDYGNDIGIYIVTLLDNLLVYQTQLLKDKILRQKNSKSKARWF